MNGTRRVANELGVECDDAEACANQGASGPYLIVNADDYGYFRCVSEGILRAASQGIVTATGVLATVPDLAEQCVRLRELDTLDVGVHLNLTQGSPLTSALRTELRWASGRFAGKYALAASVLAGTISVKVIRQEWRAQIERALGYGLVVRFLNSHEHVHMLPPLLSVVTELSEHYAIPHVRFTVPHAGGASSMGVRFRGVIMGALSMIGRRRISVPSAVFLGLEASGRLDTCYLAQVIPRLEPGRVYELMCHPGTLDPGEVRDGRLLRYHDWEGELRTLVSPAVRELLKVHGVKLIGYRNLCRGPNQLFVSGHVT